MEKEKYGIIYMVRNIVNNKIYFGQTVHAGGFDGRYGGNLYKNTHNSHLKHSIEKYGIDNFEISKEFDIGYSKNELDSLEEMYIKMYKTTDDRYGYNKSSGGLTNTLNKESRKQISESLKKYFLTASPPNKGIPMTEEMKKKISESRKGICVGEEHHSSKKIVCLNTGKIYPTILQASRDAGVSDSGLSSCCKGRLSCFGFSEKLNERLVWAYYEDFLKMSEEDIQNKIEKANNREWVRKKLSDAKKGKPSPKKKKVVCLNTGEIFDSATEAAESCGKTRKGVGLCCSNKNMSCGRDTATGKKLVWVYYENYIHMTKEEIDAKIQFANKKVLRGPSPNVKSRKIVCLNTGETFETLTEAQRVYGVNTGSVLRCCRGEGKSCGIHPVTKEKLKWAYFDEL